MALSPLSYRSPSLPPGAKTSFTMSASPPPDAGDDDRIYEDVFPQDKWVHGDTADTLIIDLGGVKKKGAEFEKEHLLVQMDDQRNLKVSGRRLLNGRHWRRFQKLHSLPPDVDSSRIRATFDGSLLSIIIPKLIANPPQPTKGSAATAGGKKPDEKKSGIAATSGGKKQDETKSSGAATAGGKKQDETKSAGATTSGGKRQDETKSAGATTPGGKKQKEMKSADAAASAGKKQGVMKDGSAAAGDGRKEAAEQKEAPLSEREQTAGAAPAVKKQNEKKGGTATKDAAQEESPAHLKSQTARAPSSPEPTREMSAFPTPSLSDAPRRRRRGSPAAKLFRREASETELVVNVVAAAAVLLGLALYLFLRYKAATAGRNNLLAAVADDS